MYLTRRPGHALGRFFISFSRVCAASCLCSRSHAIVHRTVCHCVRGLGVRGANVHVSVYLCPLCQQVSAKLSAAVHRMRIVCTKHLFRPNKILSSTLGSTMCAHLCFYFQVLAARTGTQVCALHKQCSMFIPLPECNITHLHASTSTEYTMNVV